MTLLNRLVWVFLGLWFLCFAPAFAQEKPQQKFWVGKLTDGRMIREKDLDKILQLHKLWLESNRKKGRKADLSNAFLRGAYLTNANLSEANLEKADLSDAYLGKAELSGAIFQGANLSRAKLYEANLSKANLVFANLTDAKLWKANLAGAKLINSNMQRADFHEANLSQTDLRLVNLREASLWKANLSGACLAGVILRGADIAETDLSKAIFQPKPGYLPDVSGLMGFTSIKGLSTLTYWESPHGLMELREVFKKGGMRTEEREVTYALNHNHRERLWKEGGSFNRLDSLFRLVFFEWTCNYGMTPSQPLLIMFVAIFVFTLPYLLALRSRDPETGIWVMLPPDRVLDRKMKDRPFKLTFRLPSLPFPKKRGYRFRGRLWRGLRAFRVAFYFSLLSAFNIGWRELNVGTWITRIQKREYNLRGTGWVRILSGLQALLSVYLLALWALTYFGRPFE